MGTYRESAVPQVSSGQHSAHRRRCRDEGDMARSSERSPHISPGHHNAMTVTSL